MVVRTPAAAARLPDGGRFIALDSLRGVAAMMVVAFHVQERGLSVGSTLIANGWLLVDLFFILSGFVISGAYGQKLSEGFSVVRFMLLRLGRLYPLHLAILAIYVAAELAVLALHALGLGVRAGFSADRSLTDLLLTALLLQGFVVPNPLVWSPPSWSISIEIWLYVVGALAYRTLGQHGMWFMSGLAAIALLVLATGFQDWFTPLSADLIRGIAGFGLGCAAWRGWDNLLRHHYHRLSKHAWTALEVAIVGIIIAFLSSQGAPGMLPVLDLLFVAGVLIFAADRGGLSRALSTWPFMWLGILAYSIYLGHMLVLSAGIKLLGFAGLIPPSGIGAVGAGVTVLAWAAILAGTVALAYVTWRWCEAPSRAWSRRLAAKMSAGAQERVAPSI